MRHGITVRVEIYHNKGSNLCRFPACAIAGCRLSDISPPRFTRKSHANFISPGTAFRVAPPKAFSAEAPAAGMPSEACFFYKKPPRMHRICRRLRFFPQLYRNTHKTTRMKKKYGFTLLTLAEFESWIKEQDVARTIFFIQEHHTFSPNYLHFKGDNHFELQKSMQNYHTVVNGWQDIGQHFSIFPDGMIVTGRSLEISPACIFGFNSNSICTENVGNFDIGGDTMRPEHKEAIVRVTAALCKRFRVPADAGRGASASPASSRSCSSTCASRRSSSRWSTPSSSCSASRSASPAWWSCCTSPRPPSRSTARWASS